VANPLLPTPHDTAVAGNATFLLMTDATTGGNTFTFRLTNLVISNTNPSAGGDDQIDVAHLGQTTGELAARLKRPLVVPADDGSSGRQLTFDYVGKTILFDGAEGTYKITVAGVTLLGGNGTNSIYTVQSSTLTLATNDVIRGQATLTLTR
jgi:hypothetical protein